MDTSSTSTDALARKIEREILRRLASVGHAHAASCVGVDESTISRWKDVRPDGKPGEIGRMARFLAALGLKTVPQTYQCYDRATLEAMITLAGQRMAQIKSADQLVFEDDE